MKIRTKLFGGFSIIVVIAVNHVNEISAKNREGIDTLIREVARFKVE